MVAGWPGGFLGSHFWRNPSPDLGCFLVYPPWPKEALIFGPCECSQAARGCQRLEKLPRECF